MASTKFLIVTAVLIAGAHAKFVWQDDNDNDFPAFKPFKIQMPVPPVPPTPPRPPFQPFAPFQPFQPFQHFQQFQPFRPFAPMPPFQPSFINIPPPHILTPDEIRNAKPGPNGVYNGVMVSSSSSMVKDKDGKWVKKGGTAVLTNQDGKVKEFKDGNAPPDINKPLKVGQQW